MNDNHIIWIIIGIFATPLLIWAVANRIMRPFRTADLREYAVLFRQETACPEALEYAEDGIHVSRMYGVDFEKVGYSDEKEFLEDAALSYEKAIMECADSEKAIAMRAKLARFKLKHLVSAEDAANAWLTQST